ncbi:MAG: colicin V production protein [Rhodanobacter sp. 68-29]|uniref:CvpA family protein n=1 Tax=Rhodanobacter sp. PCA2 TaxID=2006117 RepID=UPI00086E0C91|nr:CvpA family protein [Rhodanobacter sp. PCA2]MBA2078678.1 colicin V production protein [Rhodanobacter sp. PCA2]MBN8921762.1 CvpA family protein [Rhodanobacter sp.]ODU72626.1 MAG: colicin V production protein [Rhodanobacter sp. SCN 69-32]OJY61251.1 MAG: colicin V production protein [Rhodanobacter sp. 68-29]
MNWIDITILGVLGLSVLIGLWRGLVSEVLALVIWIAAFWVAWLFGPTMSAQLHMITVPAARIAAGYALCFVLVLLLGALLRFLMLRLLASTGLSGTDRLLGMVFGLARGVLLVCVLVFLCQFTAFTREPPWRQSLLLPPFQSATIWLGQRIPPGVREHFHPDAVTGSLRERLDPATVAGALRGHLDTPAPSGTLHKPSAATISAPGTSPVPAASVSSSNHP